MQAYENGAVIQERNKQDPEWRDIHCEPTWDWQFIEYRIKPELKLRPYKNAEEFLAAQKEHGMYLSPVSINRNIFPIEIDNYGISVVTRVDTVTKHYSYKFLVENNWKHQD